MLLVLVAIAAIYDIRFRRIPNWITLSAIPLSVLVNTSFRGWSGLLLSLCGLLLAFTVYFALYAIRAMGAGDVKLMAAIGAMVGWQNWIAIFLITAIVGGIAALVLVTWRRRLKKTLWNLAFILTELKSGRPAYHANQELDVRSSKGLGLPHGAVIAAATIIFLGICAQRYWAS
jgi:prepilin peptidase CpaA